MTGALFLVYAFYVLQIGGGTEYGALQLARQRWGYVMIVLFICMIILSFPTGKLIDKIGRKIPLIISSLFMIPAILLFIYGNYSTLFIVMPLFGFTQLLGFSAYQTLFADLVPQAHRGKVTGSMNFFTYLFMAIGGIAGGLLYDTASPQLPFLLMPILIVPSVLLVVFYVHEPKPEEREA